MAAPAKRVTLGRIAGVFGVKGWVKVRSFTRPIDNILKYPRWWIAQRPNGAPEFEAQLVDSRGHGNGPVALISDASGAVIDDRDVAAALVGSEIQVERSALPRLKKGEYYWVDLIGLEVQNVDGVALGVIHDMTSNGAQDVMVLRDGDTERLIPFVHGPIVKAVDMKARRVVCDWQPEF